MTLWFFSDPHFSHVSLLRPRETTGAIDRYGFTSVDQMNDTIVDRHNAVVKPSDHWYCLGDVSMPRYGAEARHYLKRLNGHGRLILGNHDETAADFAGLVEKIHGYRDFAGLLFSHMPVAPWSVGADYKGNVHGHCHRGKPHAYTAPDLQGRREVRYLNISAEWTNYTPLSLEECLMRIGGQ